jgi:hypothetical protein
MGAATLLGRRAFLFMGEESNSSGGFSDLNLEGCETNPDGHRNYPLKLAP